MIMDQSITTTCFVIVAQVLLGFFFAFFGVLNFTTWRVIRDYMRSIKIPCATPFLFLGILWQFVLGIMLILNFHTFYVAILLVPFTVIAALIFHQYWRCEGEVRQLNLVCFVTQLTATLGGLLLLIGTHLPR